MNEDGFVDLYSRKLFYLLALLVEDASALVVIHKNSLRLKIQEKLGFHGLSE